MKKSDIIAKTLADMQREHKLGDEDLQGVIATLNERLPEGESRICAEFDLNVACCEICHIFYAHYEMYAVELPGVGNAWICCAVRSFLFPKTALESWSPTRLMELFGGAKE
jgi:hypothetical protein